MFKITAMTWLKIVNEREGVWSLLNALAVVYYVDPAYSAIINMYVIYLVCLKNRNSLTFYVGITTHVAKKRTQMCKSLVI